MEGERKKSMYRKDSEGWLKHTDFIILDMICLQLAYVLAYAISGYGFNPYETIIYRNMAVFLELADLVMIFAYLLHRRQEITHRSFSGSCLQELEWQELEVL